MEFRSVQLFSYYRLLHNTISFNYPFIEVILLKEELWGLFMISYFIKI
jgi:hypothetical protein